MRVLGTISLPGVPRSAPEARGFVRRTVEARLELDPCTSGDVELCVDELVANACEHTASGCGGRVTVTVGAGRGILRVTVADEGGTDGKPHVAAGFGEDGRGLRLVDALALCWGVDEKAAGTEVWAEFLAPHPARTSARPGSPRTPERTARPVRRVRPEYSLESRTRTLDINLS